MLLEIGPSGHRVFDGEPEFFLELSYRVTIAAPGLGSAIGERLEPPGWRTQTSRKVSQFNPKLVLAGGIDLLIEKVEQIVRSRAVISI